MIAASSVGKTLLMFVVRGWHSLSVTHIPPDSFCHGCEFCPRGIASCKPTVVDSVLKRLNILALFCQNLPGLTLLTAKYISQSQCHPRAGTMSVWMKSSP